MHKPHLFAALCTLSLIVSACGSDAGKQGKVAAITETATFVAGGSIEQVWVTDANPGDVLVLADGNSNEVGRGTADRLGSLIYRNIAPGDGYTVRLVNGSSVDGTKPFRVLSEADVPDSSLYNQTLLGGAVNYVKMRDGIELAMTVRLPSGMTLVDGKIMNGTTEVGPLPTIIEYSGYQVAAPHDLLSAVVQAIGSGQPLNTSGDPLLPDTATVVGSLIAPILGFAAVSVQMRGSGCSGGDFQLFDLPTTYDGYDAIEVVAAQPWVKGGMVGMGGISFSGISQLFVGGTRPPHLAALSPMSVMDDIYDAPGFPGGIFNSGFAQSWLQERQDNAHPAPETGAQPYAVELVNEGDQHCIDNQKLRLQTQLIKTLIEKNPFRVPDLEDHRSPNRWADKIDVPVFLVGAYQDEQTGGHFPEMLHELDGNPDVWFSIQNGVHCDSLGPATFTRWMEFLNLFVGKQIPVMPALVPAASKTLYQQIASGSGSMDIPPTRFDSYTDVAAATAKFREDPRVRLLFENGGNPADLGSLQPMWEHGFDAWPLKEGVATSYYLGPNGTLTTAAPSTEEVSYTGDPLLRPLETLGGTGTGDSWSPLPGYDWAPVAAGAGLGFVTPVLTEDTLVIGTSSLDLALKASATDTDLQVSLSEVRPDGQEMYVQSGWLRASHRALDAAASTVADPVHTNLEADAKPVPQDTFDLARVQIYAVGHAFRAGSRIRVTIQAPGGERTRWAFDTIENGTITDTIQLGPSKLVLPLVPNVPIPTPLPPCPSLRGQPCRTYTPASNGG